MSASTQTALVTADEIEAKAHERIAEGHTLLAQARRMRAVPAAGNAWLLLGVAAVRLGIRVHVLRDAARRGELALGQIGRRSAVRESELDRWIIAKRPPSKTAANDTVEDPRAAARAAVSAAANRVGGSR